MLNQLAEAIKTTFPQSRAEAVNPEVGTGHIKIDASCILEVCRYLRDQKGFNVLELVSGVDFADRIEVNYMVAQFGENSGEAILKVALPKSGADQEVEIESVVSVWSAADFQERECYDLLGVRFNGHPDLRRILCPEDWQGFPLRKDYIVQEVYQGMTVNPIEKVNQADHFFYKEVQAKYDPKKVSFSWKDDSENNEEDAEADA